MFQSAKNGWCILKSTNRALLNNKVFFVPLLFVWIIYAAVIIYLKYYFPIEKFSALETFLISYFVIFFFAFLFSTSCLVVLELMERIESGKPANIYSATHEVITKNLLKALPTIIIWSLIWFILLLIEVIIKRASRIDDDDSSINNEVSEELNIENAAKTLAGYADGNWSITTEFFHALLKGVRMLSFLVLPAIAWENSGPILSIKKGLKLARRHWKELSWGFVITEAAAITVFMPPAILLKLSKNSELPDFVWYVVLIYIAFAWSYVMLIEQFYAAELYLWDKKWQRECEKARAENKEEPKLSDIKSPSLLDGINDL